jgi:pimeloyl-ACP methyl ester carboxylesterase
VARRLAQSGALSEDRLEALKQRYGSPDYRASSGVMRDVLVRAIAEERSEAYTPALRAMSCPVELVWGALDTAAPPRVAERIASELGPAAHLQVFDGVGHLTPDEIPQELRAAIDRLVASVPS